MSDVFGAALQLKSAAEFQGPLPVDGFYEVALSPQAAAAVLTDPSFQLLARGCGYPSVPHSASELDGFEIMGLRFRVADGCP